MELKELFLLEQYPSSPWIFGQGAAALHKSAQAQDFAGSQGRDISGEYPFALLGAAAKAGMLAVDAKSRRSDSLYHA